MPTESIWIMDRDQRRVVWFSTALVKITGMDFHTGHDQRRNQYFFSPSLQDKVTPCRVANKWTNFEIRRHGSTYTVSNSVPKQ
jgi:hypothetical protein